MSDFDLNGMDLLRRIVETLDRIETHVRPIQAAATTPANPTDQIATVAATPVVAPDAQRYDWRRDLDSIEACEEASECADGCCTFFTPRHNDECIRLAAHIERLEAERDAAERDAATLQSIVGNTVKAKTLRELFRAYSNGELVARFDLEADLNTVKAERDALRLRVDELSRMVDAGLQVSAERVIHGE